MFKVASDTAVPGFRVGLPDELPGFSIDENGSARRPLPTAPAATAFGYDPYGNVLQTMAPTAFGPAGMLPRANDEFIPAQYRPYVPVSGGTPIQDPLRQAVDRASAPVYGGTPSQDPLRQALDRAANPYIDPNRPPKPNFGVIVGGLLGGMMGGILGAGIGSPVTGPIGAAIGATIGGMAPGVMSGPAGQSLGEAAAAGATPGGL